MIGPKRALPASLLEQWPDAVLIADAKGAIAYVNPAFERLTGYAAREVLGRTPHVLSSGRHDARFYRRLWRDLRSGRAFRGVFLNRRKTGELFHEEETIGPVRVRGRIAGFVSTGRDVTSLVRRLQRLERLATHDPLTGLPNRTLYGDRLAQALREAERRHEALLVALVDLDNFKRINTRYGHLAGDAVLKAVATRTRRCMRAIDTVARVGGDEFALALPGMRSRAAAAIVLEKIRTINAAPLRHAGARIPVTVSIGASLYPRDGRSEMRLRRNADRAMYAAKAAGGNRCRFAVRRA